jgi:hypothetical protein
LSQHLRCHCGAVQADVDVSLEGAMTCNCSICGRTGAIMAFVPADALTNVVGEDQLTDYQFGAKSIDGVDVHAIEIAQRYDGRNL